MRWLILIFLPCLALGQTPIDYNKWKHEGGSRSMSLGGQLSNYKDSDSTFALIDNTFLTDGDSLYCATSILKTAVTDNGQSVVRLTWAGNTYEVVQKPIKLIWLNGQTKAWVDVIPGLSWGTPSVSGNMIQWSFPGFKYSVLKNFQSVSHRFDFNEPFLDSATILYNQRSDSAHIYLGAVFQYSFVNVGDSTLLDIAEVPMKRLARWGKSVFDISKQSLRFDGSDTAQVVPVGQRWIKQGGEIYCVEYVKFGAIKEVVEQYSLTSVWHNAELNFLIDSATTIEATYIEEFAPQDNSGGAVNIDVGDAFNNVRDLRILLRFTSLDDSMRAIGTVASWDSAIVGLYINYAGGLNAGTSVPDSIITTVHKITTIGWQEGSAVGADEGGVTWDSASAEGTGSLPDPLDWTLDGGDYSATVETCGNRGDKGDSVVFVGGEWNATDTAYFGISGATVADTMGNHAGLLIKARSADGDDAGDAAFLRFYPVVPPTTNRHRWPILRVYYTEGAPPEGNPQVIIIGMISEPQPMFRY